MPTEWPLPKDPDEDEPQFLIAFNSVCGHRCRIFVAPSQMLQAMDMCIAWWKAGFCYKYEAEAAMDRVAAVCDNYRTGRKVAAVLGFRRYET